MCIFYAKLLKSFNKGRHPPHASCFVYVYTTFKTAGCLKNSSNVFPTNYLQIYEFSFGTGSEE